jgi:hypothetical protein
MKPLQNLSLICVGSIDFKINAYAEAESSSLREGARVDESPYIH